MDIKSQKCTKNQYFHMPAYRLSPHSGLLSISRSVRAASWAHVDLGSVMSALRTLLKLLQEKTMALRGASSRVSGALACFTKCLSFVQF